MKKLLAIVLPLLISAGAFSQVNSNYWYQRAGTITISQRIYPTYTIWTTNTPTHILDVDTLKINATVNLPRVTAVGGATDSLLSINPTTNRLELRPPPADSIPIYDSIAALRADIAALQSTVTSLENHFYHIPTAILIRDTCNNNLQQLTVCDDTLTVTTLLPSLILHYPTTPDVPNWNVANWNDFLNIGLYSPDSLTAMVVIDSTVYLYGADGLTNLIIMYTVITQVEISDSLTHLITINLNYNDLRTFTCSASWVNLQHLFLAHNRLTTITESIALTSLHDVRLGWNFLSTFSGAGWVALTWLDLSNNDFATWTGLTTWTLLIHLDLSNNQLIGCVGLPEWTALVHFDLSNNQLATVTLRPEWTALDLLNLSNNLLTTVTLSAAWTSFTTLLLNDNQFTTVTLYAAWINMYWIELQNNQLTTATGYAAWVNMYYFDLSNNLIVTYAGSSAWVAISYINLYNNALDLTSVDGALSDVSATGMTWGTLYLDGGTNSAPTDGTSNAAYVDLTTGGKYWNITINP